MPRVPEEEVVRLASLARIRLAEGEAASLAADLESILEHVASLEAADTSGVTDQTVGAGSFRDDTATDRIGAATARDAFPDTDGAFLKVPRVLPTHDD